MWSKMKTGAIEQYLVRVPFRPLSGKKNKTKKSQISLRLSLLGAENETRTRDPNLGKVVLYQLSYFRIVDSAPESNHFLIASAKIGQIFFLCKLFAKKF